MYVLLIELTSTLDKIEEVVLDRSSSCGIYEACTMADKRRQEKHSVQ
jgi:hypothetical protein